MPSACVLLANGFEEIEAVTVLDVLRRADIDAKSVGVTGTTVTGSHGIVLQAELRLQDALAQPWDLVVLPGGIPGATHLRDDAGVQELLKAQAAKGKRLAAICAAPIALASAGVLQGKRVTSYPSFQDKLGEVVYLEETVVIDGQITTSRGPATALKFALELVRQLRGEMVADKVKTAMLAT